MAKPDKQQEDFDKLVKGVVNSTSKGVVLVLNVEGATMKSQMVSHGLPFSSISHFLMEAYISAAPALLKNLQAEHESREASQA